MMKKLLKRKTEIQSYKDFLRLYKKTVKEKIEFEGKLEMLLERQEKQNNNKYTKKIQKESTKEKSKT